MSVEVAKVTDERAKRRARGAGAHTLAAAAVFIAGRRDPKTR